MLKFLIYFLAAMTLAFDSSVSAENASSVSEISCNLEKGEVVFKKCAACHSLEENKAHKSAPNLFGLKERTSGTVEDFKFSRAMRDASIVWTEESLDTFLENPRTYIPRNRMAFSGIKDTQDRMNLICFILKTTEN